MKAWLGAAWALGMLATGAIAVPFQATDDAPEKSKLSYKEQMEQLLEGFTTLSTDFKRWTRGDDPINIFDDLDLDFVYIEAPSGEDVPGLKFDYDRTFGERDRKRDGDWSSFLALKSVGTLSFDGDVQPRDMISTRLTWRYALDSGGVNQRDRVDKLFGNSHQSNVADLDDLADIENPNELDRDEAWQSHASQSSDLLGDQLHWDLGLDLGLENTQDWSQRQFRFGVASSVEFKTFRSDSKLRWLNIVDYPASAIRWLTRYDTDWSPSGTTIPSLGVDVSQVFVDDNRARRQAGDESDFTRIHAELAYRSPLGEIGSKLYHVDMGYHYYLDVDPSNSIEAAELDAYDYLKVEFTSDEGVFFSIDVGQLPFEARDTTVMSLGYRVAAR